MLSLRLATLLAFGIIGVQAQETVTFRLHKFEQPIGTETVSITRVGSGRKIDSTFEFTDRGTKVPLKATLLCARDYTPQDFTISGSTSRMSTIHASVSRKGVQALVKGADTEMQTVASPKRFFTIAGYAPAAMEEALLIYWLKHGKPAQLDTLPSGRVTIAITGRDTFTISGRQSSFRRFSIQGLVWGLETAWLDDKDGLAALVTRDAEFDHFEAVRESYEPALADFVTAAARDQVARLAELSTTLEGRRSGSFAFTGGALINGIDERPISPATVVIRKGRIVAAGPAESVSIPPDVEIIDAKGKYLIPGLWDMHAHYEQVEWGPIYLAAGVTTVRDVGNEFGFITAVRDANNSGTGLGPRMLLAGVVDGDGPFALGMQRVNSAADADSWVKKYHDAGFEQIKIYSSVKPEIVKAICADAHALGMTVTGHIPINMTILDGISAGMDQVNHISYVTDLLRKQAGGGKTKETWQSLDANSEAAQSLITTLKEHHTVIDDTAALFELFAQPFGHQDLAEPGIKNVAPELRGQFENGGSSAESLPFAKLRWTKTLEIMGALHRAGITFVAGTDQAVPGYSVYRELELYVQAGFAPFEALQAATIVPARVMRHESDSGSIEAGKRADFDILDANPLADIHNIRSVHWVVANGVLYDPKPLWEAVGFKAPN